MEKKDLYSLGSIVYLEDGTKKIMIVGRGVIYTDEEEEKEMFVDYLGCIYPEGINPNNTIFFNHENVDRLLFEGFKDEEEERFLEIYSEWEKEIETPKKKID